MRFRKVFCITPPVVAIDFTALTSTPHKILIKHMNIHRIIIHIKTATQGKCQVRFPAQLIRNETIFFVGEKRVLLYLRTS